MRIIELRASAFKRLSAVSITPSGRVVEISGDNSSGKTSTLDAIWAALGGKDACPDKPIRTGEDSAFVSVLLGDTEPRLRVTRTFRLKEGAEYTTDLKVEAADTGARFPSQQGVLDALVGAMCFDPLAFTRMKDEEQIKALRQFVPGVNFAEIEGLNRRDFEERTAVGRRLRDMKGQLAALPAVAAPIPEEVDTHALEQQLARAGQHNAEVATQTQRQAGWATRLQEVDVQILRLQDERDKLADLILQAIEIADPIDTDDVQRKLAEGRRANEVVADVKAREAMWSKISATEDEETALTAAIAKRKEDMAAKVKGASMPIPGLGFGEDHVTLNGEPFSQASQAQKIRASVAIAAAMNPKLRVARVMDGSLLDAKSWAALEEYAEEADLQVWIETVSPHTSAAVIIEDGGVYTPPVADDEVVV